MAGRGTLDHNELRSGDAVLKICLFVKDLGLDKV
jgi:hypothetical protein